MAFVSARRWRPRQSLPFAIAHGAMAGRRKVIRRRRVWPGSATNISKMSLAISAHTRDNPFSKQYMWGAAANLSREPCAIWRCIFRRSPKAADDGDRGLGLGGTIYQEGCPTTILSPASSVMARMRRVSAQIPGLGGCRTPI